MEQFILKPARPLPLLELYDFLHTFCLNMQLNILYQQACHLARTRWANNLFLETDGTQTQTHFEEPLTFLKVYYWSALEDEEDDNNNTNLIDVSKGSYLISEFIESVVIINMSDNKEKSKF
ncbi:hypothetical protein C2G38_2032775 [Gigaspora rosea]|uniref:Uncharacterized protein n=1 Tax=Gigaspora rosea TaxID=44941 RepID=A0A397VNP9_9GLOM|nr:hypothetical protein C2G38_2032775 [Gigaspora rosea]